MPLNRPHEATDYPSEFDSFTFSFLEHSILTLKTKQPLHVRHAEVGLKETTTRYLVSYWKANATKPIHMAVFICGEESKSRCDALIFILLSSKFLMQCDRARKYVEYAPTMYAFHNQENQ